MRADVIAEGLYFGEGPRWHDGRLWFSDFYDHAVKSVDEDGSVATQFELAGQPSGLGWMPDGTLLVVSMLDRRVLRMNGELVPHADLSSVATYHCNDMVVDRQGRAYVGNFGFDLDHELTTRGAESVLADHDKAALALVQPDGSVSVAATNLSFPNGAVITPDGRTLILAETLGARLTAFDIAEDGSLSGRHTWAELSEGVPDGICLDEAGHVWYANPLGTNAICVAEGGKVIANVETSAPCYACMLGGRDGRTLFCLTAATSVASEVTKERTGKVEASHVDIAHAGLP